MWIDCNEALPEPGVLVSIWCPNPRSGIGFKFQYAYLKREGTNAIWENHATAIQLSEVTHWRETPPEPNTD